MGSRQHRCVGLPGRCTPRRKQIQWPKHERFVGSNTFDLVWQLFGLVDWPVDHLGVDRLVDDDECVLVCDPPNCVRIVVMIV